MMGKEQGRSLDAYFGCIVCYSPSHSYPRESSHFTEAEGEGGWQTAAVSAPAG